MGAFKMKMHAVAATFAFVMLAPLAHGAELNLGRDVTPEELAGWDITVFSDGTGYPAGKGTVAQGQKIYENSCVACHGAKLEGGIGPALVGGAGTLTSDKPLKTVGSYWPYASTLFDYTRRAMPFQAPQSLSNDEVYSLAAYILHENDLFPADGVADAATLKEVKMPNRDAFYVDDRPDVQVQRCMTDCEISSVNTK